MSLVLSRSTFEANHGPSSACPACMIMKTAVVKRSSSSAATKLAADLEYKNKNDGDDFCKVLQKQKNAKGSRILVVATAPIYLMNPR